MKPESIDPGKVQRENFLAGLKARHLIPEPIEGTPDTIISLSDLTDYYFPDGSFPLRQQMREKLQFFGNIFHQMSEEKVSRNVITPYPISFWLSAENILPIVRNEISPQHPGTSVNFPLANNLFRGSKSAEYNLFMNISKGPTFHLKVNCAPSDFLRIFINKLGKNMTLDEIDPKGIGQSQDCRVFRMPRNDKIMVPKLEANGKNTSQKTPFVILEQKVSIIGRPYVSLRLAVDTKSDDKTIEDYSQTRDLFRFKIESSSDPQFESAVNWNSEWIKIGFTGQNANIPIPNKTINILNQPMDITKFGTRRYVELPPHYIFPLFLKAKERFPIDSYDQFAATFYYFLLAKLAAKMVHQAIFGGFANSNIPAVTSDTMHWVNHELSQITRENRQYFANTLVWMGFDIWEDLDDIAFQLTSALNQDNHAFWYYFNTMGLYKLFPSAKNALSRVGSNKLLSADEFSLFPELSWYYDHRPGKEREQSDEYFMNICLALAWYAESIGEEPYGAVIVKNGKIIASAHNEIKKSGGDHSMHAEIIAINRARKILKDETLNDCRLFTTASPCDECAYQIRVRNGIYEVCIGVDSTMKGEVLSNNLLKTLGLPFGDPPIVNILELKDLKDKFRILYIENMGWTNQFRSLVTDPDSDFIRP